MQVRILPRLQSKKGKVVIFIVRYNYGNKFDFMDFSECYKRIKNLAIKVSSNEIPSREERTGGDYIKASFILKSVFNGLTYSNNIIHKPMRREATGRMNTVH